MKESIAFCNEIRAKQMINLLVYQGIRYFCIAPGSRCTPLTLAVSEHPLAETFVHFDERGLGFHALGYAKGANRIAAIIVTSGTAVGNLLPAVMEASHDHVPLVLLTADRPPDLHQCGANQTCDQTKIFQNYIRFQVDLPCPHSENQEPFINSIITTALSYARSEPKGPVHLNCMFKEPFFSDPSKDISPIFIKNSPTFPYEFTSNPAKLNPSQIEHLADDLSSYEKGIIIVGGGMPSHFSIDALFTLSRLLQWPLFPDILSPLSSYQETEGIISHFDLILKSGFFNEDFSLEAVIQFGNRFVSKQLLKLLETLKPKSYTLITEHHVGVDPTHLTTHRIVAHPWELIQDLITCLPGRPVSSWLDYWKEMNRLTVTFLSSFFQEHTHLTEASFFHTFSSFSLEGKALFLGNSLPIRGADMFFKAHKKFGPIFGNRGLSGIDGNLSTAMGISKGLKKPLIAILGDLTFLHDLNALSQIKKNDFPILWIIINNDGGGIFSFLPIKKKKRVFSRFFSTPHGLDFKKSALLFKLNYQLIETLDEIKAAIDTFDLKPKIIELKVKQQESLEMEQKLILQLKELLAASPFLALEES